MTACASLLPAVLLCSSPGPVVLFSFSCSRLAVCPHPPSTLIKSPLCPDFFLTSTCVFFSSSVLENLFLHRPITFCTLTSPTLLSTTVCASLALVSFLLHFLYRSSTFPFFVSEIFALFLEKSSSLIASSDTSPPGNAPAFGNAHSHPSASHPTFAHLWAPHALSPGLHLLVVDKDLTLASFSIVGSCCFVFPSQSPPLGLLVLNDSSCTFAPSSCCVVWPEAPSSAFHPVPFFWLHVYVARMLLPSFDADVASFSEIVVVCLAILLLSLNPKATVLLLARAPCSPGFPNICLVPYFFSEYIFFITQKDC